MSRRHILLDELLSLGLSMFGAAAMVGITWAQWPVLDQ